MHKLILLEQYLKDLVIKLNTRRILKQNSCIWKCIGRHETLISYAISCMSNILRISKQFKSHLVFSSIIKLLAWLSLFKFMDTGLEIRVWLTVSRNHLCDSWVFAKKSSSALYSSCYISGTRMCPGKNLSEWQLFLLLTSILQRFDLQLDGQVSDDVYGLIRYPGDFKIVCRNRKLLTN